MLNTQGKKDLRALLDYVQDDTEREDFMLHLRENRGWSKKDLAKLDKVDEDADIWTEACSDPNETHAYAIAWRLRGYCK